MATATDIQKGIILRYADRGSFRFNRISMAANDQQLYNLAAAFNLFQADKAEKVIKTTTQLIV
jgi:hypothetical protein